MDSMLEALYAFAPDMVSEEERAIMEREGEFLDGIEERLSVEDFGHLWDILIDLSIARMEENFSLGYRLGLQLVLDPFDSLKDEMKRGISQKISYSRHYPVEPGGSCGSPEPGMEQKRNQFSG